jgi:hypothetical protein
MSVEDKALALEFGIERGLHKGAGYQLRNSSSGGVAIGDGYTASLKQLDKFLDEHLKDMAKALGFRLTTAPKGVMSLNSLSAGEARAAQHAEGGGT